MTKQELTAKVNAYRGKLNTATETLDDKTALDVVALFPAWAADVEYTADQRVRYDGKLYRIVQSHTSQAHYPPSINTAALYAEVVADEEAGTLDNPIPYSGNMALEKGKYYAQDGVVYICTRDTVNPVYNALADLVGLYVERVTE